MPQQGMTDLSRLRKRLLEADAATSAGATIAYSSEDPAHPVEHMLDGQSGPGATRWMSHRTRRWREQDSNPRSPLGEELKYEISRQDRGITSRPDRGVARPRPTCSSTARPIDKTAEPDRRRSASSRARPLP